MTAITATIPTVSMTVRPPSELPTTMYVIALHLAFTTATIEESVIHDTHHLENVYIIQKTEDSV